MSALSKPTLQWSSREADLTAAQVVRLRGVEEVSRLYRFEVVLFVSDRPRRPLVGTRGTLVLTSGTSSRSVHAVVHRARARALSDGTAGFELALSLRPAHDVLRRRYGSRVFQDRSAAEIALDVLARAGLPARAMLSAPGSRRGYCVQHEQTDLAFVERILAEDGLSYFFDHDGAEEALVITDGADGLPELGDRPYRPGSGLDADAQTTRELELVERARPTRASLREFDLHRPSHRLSGSAGAEGAEVYTHHAEPIAAHVSDAGAQLALEQERRDTTLASGTTHDATLTAARRFSISDGPFDASGELVAVRVEHRGELRPAANEARYENRFVALRPGTPLRPLRPRPRLRQVLETATVVGPPGEEIHTDALGRIKVQFHWDREGGLDERSSCWIRVMQPWSGAAWGSQFIPRIGMEVVVLFGRGDVDHPLVVGAVPNAEHPPPFPLPREKTKSGLRTQSTPGSVGYHEVSFEDASGRELLHVRAERDLDAIVRNDARSSVGRDQSAHVARHRQETVGGGHTETVGGSHALAIGEHAVRVVAGNDTQTVFGAGQLQFAQGLSLSVDSGRDTRIAGADDLRVGGSLATAVRGEQVTQVGGARIDVTGGTHVVIASGGGRGEASLSLRGAAGVSLDGGEEVSLRAPRIVLQAGSSSLELTDEGVVIRARKLEAHTSASLELTSKASSLMLDTNAALLGAKSVVEGGGSRLVLSASATLEGAAISLGSGAGAEASAEADPRPPADPEAPLELGVTIPAYLEGGPTGALVVRDEDRVEVRRVEASAATRNERSFYVFELDPRSLPDRPLEVVFERQDLEEVLVPLQHLVELRDQLVARRPRVTAPLLRGQRRAIGPPRAQGQEMTELTRGGALDEELEARLRARGALPACGPEEVEP